MQLGTECIRPDFHAGRQKGIKKYETSFSEVSIFRRIKIADGRMHTVRRHSISKRVGLDKALFQVEQAVKRAKTGKQRTVEDGRILTHIRNLMSQIDRNDFSPDQASSSQDRHEDDGASSSDDAEELTDPAASQAVPSELSNARQTEESLAVDDAENPLQLLARASYFQPSRDTGSHRSPGHVRKRGIASSGNPESMSVEAFFSGATVSLDVGSDIDPIDLGLVTEEEAESLFSL